MSQWDKLIKRLYTIPGDMRFEELKKILIRYGYTDNNPRGGSSHHTFRKPGCAPHDSCTYTHQENLCPYGKRYR